jgi:hypothetical protein
VLYRRLIFVALLSGCDYLLWDWSLAGNHSGEAIVSGLTLPVLLAVLVWLTVLTLARAIGSSRSRRTTGSPVAIADRAGQSSTALSSIAEDRPAERDAVSATGKLAA